jgi:hypothetical protein
LAKRKILSDKIRNDIELPDEPIAVYLKEKQHRQTLIRTCLKRNSTTGYEYLRGTVLNDAGLDQVMNQPSFDPRFKILERIANDIIPFV